MASNARLKTDETLADRFLKVNHAGEHGAISIYRGQRWIARLTAPEQIEKINEFLAHERKHRALFAAELDRRGRRRCRSYHLCGFGGWALGLITGALGARAIDATTEAVEAVVLRHLEEQLRRIPDDAKAANTIQPIIEDEQEHHDRSLVAKPTLLTSAIHHIVKWSTEAVIWLGMKL